MTVLSLCFEGWFQCRLPTNPDPTDEPRGVSGSTFALAGEPDLDRVIRWQKPVALRSHSPQIGVRVTNVKIDGQKRPDHILVGAAVDLLDEPRFEERNGIIAKAGEAPIDPFWIAVRGPGVIIRRNDFWDTRRPQLKIYEVPPHLLRRRQPTNTGYGMFEMASPEVADATGIADYPGYFAERLNQLTTELEATKEPVVRLALQKRIREIERGTWLQHFRLGFQINYKFALNGRPEVIDEGEALRGKVLTSIYWLPHWPIRFWMGCFDSDTLCAYVQGDLNIPFIADK